MEKIDTDCKRRIWKIKLKAELFQTRQSWRSTFKIFCMFIPLLTRGPLYSDVIEMFLRHKEPRRKADSRRWNTTLPKTETSSYIEDK